MNSRQRTKIQLAIVNGAFLLAGGISGGVISNWDKIFGPSIIEAPYSGYKPTGEFDIEARYFMDVSGTRKDFDMLISTNMEAFDTLIQDLKQKIKSSSEEGAENNIDTLNRLLSIADEEKANADEIIGTILSVYKKYYTVEEIQELNKFFSTDLMRAMVSKSPAIWGDLLPALRDLEMKRIQRYARRIRSEFPEDQEIQKAADFLESVTDQE